VSFIIHILKCESVDFADDYSAGFSDVQLSLVGMKSSFGGIGYEAFPLDVANLTFRNVGYLQVLWRTAALSFCVPCNFRLLSLTKPLSKLLSKQILALIVTLTSQEAQRLQRDRTMR